jgi:hypothetical protein
MNTFRDIHTLFEAMTHLVESLCLATLMTLKVKMPLICFVGTRSSKLSIIEQQSVLFLKMLLRNKAFRNLKNSTLIDNYNRFNK